MANARLEQALDSAAQDEERAQERLEAQREEAMDMVSQSSRKRDRAERKCNEAVQLASKAVSGIARMREEMAGAVASASANAQRVESAVGVVGALGQYCEVQSSHFEEMQKVVWAIRSPVTGTGGAKPVPAAGAGPDPRLLQQQLMTAQAQATTATKSLAEFSFQMENFQSVVEQLWTAEEAVEASVTCLGCLQMLDESVTFVPCGHTLCVRCATKGQDKTGRFGNCKECATPVDGSFHNTLADEMTAKHSFRKQALSRIKADISQRYTTSAPAMP